MMYVGNDRIRAAVNQSRLICIHEITDPYNVVLANLCHTENAEGLCAEYGRWLNTGMSIVHRGK